MNVARPWDGGLAYDFVVEVNGKLCRVQVKSCSYKRSDGWYQCNYRGYGRPPYAAGEFDFVAVYVIPRDFWYIIPTVAISGLREGFAVLPHTARSKYYRFEEAWHLLSGQAGGPGL
jgi:hypothetical protein